MWKGRVLINTHRDHLRPGLFCASWEGWIVVAFPLTSRFKRATSRKSRKNWDFATVTSPCWFPKQLRFIITQNVNKPGHDGELLDRFWVHNGDYTFCPLVSQTRQQKFSGWESDDKSSCYHYRVTTQSDDEELMDAQIKPAPRSHLNKLSPA